MIKDNEIDDALHFLSAHAEEHAQAKATRIYLEKYTEVLMSQLMRKQLSNSLAAQRRDALCEPAYDKHLSGLRVAIEEDERNRFLRGAAEAKIEAWRTLNANARVAAKI
jgi:hypothetical protein